METAPRFFLIISIRIVHKLWAFVRSKEPMVRGGDEMLAGVMLVVELDGVQGILNQQ